MSDRSRKPLKLVREMVVRNAFGFHARPAAMFAKVASQFESEIMIEKDGIRVSAKSVMGLLGLEAARGTVIKVEAEGPDAKQALDELEALIESGFGENDDQGQDH